MALHKRVLISNRGEIAIRIAKAASALGMESVGVYPAADALSLHTRFTTQSQEIGGAAGLLALKLLRGHIGQGSDGSLRHTVG